MILKLGFELRNVELWGFEPLASCMPCTLQTSLGVAGRRLVWRSPAASVAGRGLAWPGVAPRWLPTWLPELVSAANVRRQQDWLMASWRRREPGPMACPCGALRLGTPHGRPVPRIWAFPGQRWVRPGRAVS